MFVCKYILEFISELFPSVDWLFVPFKTEFEVVFRLLKALSPALLFDVGIVPFRVALDGLTLVVRALWLEELRLPASDNEPPVSKLI
jgi:hypothetical protein